MAELPIALPLGRQASFGTLLAEVAEGVVQAQRRLDADAESRVTDYVTTPQGEVTLPPLWYTFSEVNVQFEMAARVTRVIARNGEASGVRLDCRLLEPVAVSLFGYDAASGFRVSLTVAPQQAMPSRVASSPDS